MFCSYIKYREVSKELLDKKTLSFHSTVVEWDDTVGNHYFFYDENIVWVTSRDNYITVLKQENGMYEKIILRIAGTKFFSYVLGGTELLLYEQDKVKVILTPKIWDSIVDEKENIYLIAGNERAIYSYKKDANVVEKYIDAPMGFVLHSIKSVKDGVLKIVGEDISNSNASRRDSYLSLDLKLKKWEVLGSAY